MLYKLNKHYFRFVIFLLTALIEALLKVGHVRQDFIMIGS